MSSSSHLSHEILTAFAHGELAESQHRAAEQHVLKCDACCDALREIDISAAVADVGQSLPNLTRPDPSVATSGDSTPAHHGQFLPGTLVAERYRIVSLLGIGGIGEVYRADDIKLGQSVALKFLGKEIAKQPGALHRLHAEVRIARNISHPNVCRVYDIGEADGQHFLSMEYIDGEDLKSLLKRIGRLPPDKGLDISRQLCAGLNAAHEQGIVHRDLKPANIMIDGRGQARITDFGLACLSDQMMADIAGTPAYMAPEQVTRGEHSVQSDLYSLALVLVEIFSGHRVYDTSSLAELKRLHEQTTDEFLLSTLNHHIEPELEQVIVRCLSASASQRPASVATVLSALPGGDPLAAVIAAGELPSPELVAATRGQHGTFGPRVAQACLATLVLGLVVLVCVPIGSLGGMIHVVDFPLEPAILVHKSRDIVKASGYFGSEEPSWDFEASGFISNGSYSWQEDTHKATDKSVVRSQSAFHFWYRLSRTPLLPERRLSTRVSLDDPPPFQLGMVALRTDLDGRLVDFHASPVVTHSEKKQSVDWSVVFNEDRIGIDFSQFEETSTDWVPQTPYDSLMAWKQKDVAEQTAMRIVAAAYRGQMVAGRIVWPHDHESTTGTRPIMETTRISIVLLVVLAAVLAPFNARRGRTDRKGAFRIAVISLCLTMFSWLFGASHSRNLSFESENIISALHSAVFVAAISWCFYLALEPFVRRFWPVALITWTRLLHGRVKDAELGRDILVGTTVGVVCHLIMKFWYQTQAIAWNAPRPFLGAIPDAILGPRQAISTIFDCGLFALSDGLFLLMFLFALRLPIKVNGIATVLFVLFFTIQFTLLSPEYALVHLLFWVSAALLLTRFGLVALICFQFVRHAIEAYPIPSDFTVWYAGYCLVPLALIAATGLYGFYLSSVRVTRN